MRLNFSEQVRKVDSEELQKALNERQKPIVLDFYATWCGPCLLLAKELEKVRSRTLSLEVCITAHLRI